LTMVHFPIPIETLKRHLPDLPPEVSLDSYDGQAWVAIVPFVMESVSLRLGRFKSPSLHAPFAELNLRTYLRVGNIASVYFFRLDVDSALAAWAARTFFGLPYRQHQIHWSRKDSSLSLAIKDRLSSKTLWTSEYRASADEPPDSSQSWKDEELALARWWTERYHLCFPQGKTWVLGRISHTKWPWQRAQGSFEDSGFGQQILDPHKSSSSEPHPMILWCPRIEVKTHEFRTLSTP
jgi:uncharacterized protein YqjF (DUF2071 family)